MSGAIMTRCGVVRMIFEDPLQALHPAYGSGSALRKAFHTIACAALLAWLAAGSGAQGQPQSRSGVGTRPNILLITVDDLNWDSLGITGSRVRGVSPNVDRLAHEGIRFT
jgi:hypothetical protein